MEDNNNPVLHRLLRNNSFRHSSSIFRITSLKKENEITGTELKCTPKVGQNFGVHFKTSPCDSTSAK